MYVGQVKRVAGETHAAAGVALDQVGVLGAYRFVDHVSDCSILLYISFQAPSPQGSLKRSFLPLRWVDEYVRATSQIRSEDTWEEW